MFKKKLLCTALALTLSASAMSTMAFASEAPETQEVTIRYNMYDADGMMQHLSDFDVVIEMSPYETQLPDSVAEAYLPSGFKVLGSTDVSYGAVDVFMDFNQNGSAYSHDEVETEPVQVTIRYNMYDTDGMLQHLEGYDAVIELSPYETQLPAGVIEAYTPAGLSVLGNSGIVGGVVDVFVEF